MIRKSKSTEKLAVAYYRMSTDKQDTSIADQKAAVEKYAAKHGYTIVRPYIDKGVSGDDTKNRKDFQKMHADASCGDFQFILCWAQDRFGRFDSMEAMYWLHPLREQGVKLVTLDAGVFDFEDSTTMLVFTINQMGKNQFLKDLSNNVTRGLLSMARQASGRRLGGKIPYGYAAIRSLEGVRVRCDMVIADDEKPETVRTIYQLFIKRGGSLTAVARELNTRKIPSPKGLLWQGSTVRLIVENPMYCGRMMWNRRHTGKYHGIHGGEQVKSYRAKGKGAPCEIRNDESQWIDAGECPAIVSRKIWDQAHALLSENRRKNIRRRDDAFALSGIIYCGNCGARLDGFREGRASNGQTRAYRCRNGNSCRKGSPHECMPGRIKEECLLPAIARKLAEFVGTPNRTERLIAKIRSGASAKSVAVDSAAPIRRKLAELDPAINASSRRLLMVPDSLVAELSAQVEAMKIEQAGLRRQLAALERQTGPTDAADIAEAAIAGIKSLVPLLAKGGVAAAEAISRCVSNVVIWFEPQQKPENRWRKGSTPRTYYRPVRGEICFTPAGVSDGDSSTLNRDAHSVRITLSAEDLQGVAA